MRDRYLNQGRDVMARARRAARRQGDCYIGTSHIVACLLSSRGSASADLLGSFGLRSPEADETCEARQIPFTPGLRLALERAANRGGDAGGLSSLHLLRGLLDAKESGGIRHLRELGIDPDQLRRRLDERLAVDHGLPEADAWPRPELPRRPRAAHKGIFGDVLVIAGSRTYAGAAVLVADGAARGGAGIVRLAVPETIADRTGAARASRIVVPCRATAAGEFSFTALPELTRRLEAADAVVIGPGLGTSSAVRDLVLALLAVARTPLVLDADALNVVAMADVRMLATCSAPLILTPHPGEAARLLGVDVPKIQAERRESARRIAQLTGAVVVLKGKDTIVSDGERVAVNSTGNPGMATGGSGDVLAGLIGALRAFGIDDFESARAGAWIHGRAGDLVAEKRGESGLLPEDILEFIPEVLDECTV